MLYMAIISILLSLATQDLCIFYSFQSNNFNQPQTERSTTQANQSERDEVKLKLVE